MRRRHIGALAFGGALAAFVWIQAGVAGEQPVPEPGDYRQEDYRAPVPSTLAGGTVLDTAAAKALWQEGKAVFVDVLPMPPKPKLPPGTYYREKPRDDIPGSIWLPDVGYGRLPPEMEAYFKDNLAKATDGDLQRSVVFYCLDDCWMSWNAARRAIAWGYKAVNWYPEGTDGWAFDDLPLESRKPIPRPGEQPN